MAINDKYQEIGQLTRQGVELQNNISMINQRIQQLLVEIAVMAQNASSEASAESAEQDKP